MDACCARILGGCTKACYAHAKGGPKGHFALVLTPTLRKYDKMTKALLALPVQGVCALMDASLDSDIASMQLFQGIGAPVKCATMSCNY